MNIKEEEIREMLLQKKSYRYISATHKVSYATISNVAKDLMLQKDVAALHSTQLPLQSATPKIKWFYRHFKYFKFLYSYYMGKPEVLN